MPDPDERARFLAALYDQARQDGEDPEAVAERIYDNLRGVSRRELLQAGGALGVGGLLGGGGGYALTQDARGQAATDDSDGNVGAPNDRVDVFADGVDGNVVSVADELVDPAGVSHTDELADLTDLVTDHGNLTNVQPSQHGLTTGPEAIYSADGINPGSPITVFSKAAGSEVAVYGGSIMGRNLNDITVTWDDGSTDNIGPGARAKGNTGDSDDFAAWVVPKMSGVRSLEIVYEEFRSVGYVIYASG